MHWASTLIHVIITYQQYVKCYRNKYLYIFQSLANTDQNSLCLPTIMTMQKILVSTHKHSLFCQIKHWEFWLKFDTWSTLACLLYTHNVILCKFGNCINHGVEMLKKTALLLYKIIVYALQETNLILSGIVKTLKYNASFFWKYHLQLETTMNCHSVILS